MSVAADAGLVPGEDDADDLLTLPDIQKLHVLLALVKEMRLTFGPIAARALWRGLNLPMPAAVAAVALEERRVAGGEPPVAPPGVDAFLKDRLIAAEGECVQGSVLYNAYKSWCREAGVRPVSMAMFGRYCGTVLHKEKRGGRVVYNDVCLAEGGAA